VADLLQRIFPSDGGVRVFLVPDARPSVEARARHHHHRHQPAVGEKLAGQTQNFTVFSDGTREGDGAARAMLDAAEDDYKAIREWFSDLDPPGLPFYVYVDPDAGGAYHMSCAGTDIHVLPDPRRAAGFLAAEVVEVFEAFQDRGWDCGQTNGEALSRVLAFARHPEIAPDFTATEQDWWGQGAKDYVNDNSAGDTDQIANGCGDLFLYYLREELTFSWSDIISAGGRTLGATYQALAGYPGKQGFDDFKTTLSKIDHKGTLALPASGNPFPIKR
jgi:hypothetical protein